MSLSILLQMSEASSRTKSEKKIRETMKWITKDIRMSCKHKKDLYLKSLMVKIIK
jgi:hypothetical protein